MTGHDLASIYEFSYFAIKRNLKELTHEDSVLIPEPSGNCINWVLGHYFCSRHNASTCGRRCTFVQ